MTFPLRAMLVRFEFLGDALCRYRRVFVHKASRARTKERRQQYAEAASFYGEVAKITPSFPCGYNGSVPFGYKGAKLPEMADRMDHRAAECLAIADLMRDLECKQRMLRLAHTYSEVSSSLRETAVSLHALLSMSP